MYTFVDMGYILGHFVTFNSDVFIYLPHSAIIVYNGFYTLAVPPWAVRLSLGRYTL
jgi:hypothetical protein